MMKPSLSLSLVWMLCSSAAALQCLVGSSRGNVNSRACTAEQLCAAVAVNTGADLRQIKACMSPSDCKPNNQTFSFNFGASQNFTAAVYCCSTDNCNRQDAAYPDAPTKQGLECFSCSGDPVCNRTVQCEGVQDHCLSGTVVARAGLLYLSGCASGNLCDASSELRFLLAGLNFTMEPKCCNTKLCNSASRFSLSAVPLLLALSVVAGF